MNISNEEYLKLIELLAKNVISVAIDEASFEVFLDQGNKTSLQKAISELARELRYKHECDDGCINEHSSSNRS